MSALSKLPDSVQTDLLSTQGKIITCKAAVAWEAKKPLEVTEIQVATPKSGKSCLKEFQNYEKNVNIESNFTMANCFTIN